MSVLLDTGFLLAVLDSDDELHKQCADALLLHMVRPELTYAQCVYTQQVIRYSGQHALKHLKFRCQRFVHPHQYQALFSSLTR